MSGRTLGLIVGAIVLVVGAMVAGVVVATADDDDDEGRDQASSESRGDASTEEFCAPYQEYMDTFTSLDFSAPDDEQVRTAVEAIKGYADALGDVGAPEDMPDDARTGMDVLVDWAGNLDPDDVSGLEDLGRFQDDFSADEQAAGEAFFSYVEGTCGGDPTNPSDLPSDLATGLPSDLPSEVPSDLLTEIPSEFLTQLPSEFPSELLSDFPSELLTEFPSQAP